MTGLIIKSPWIEYILAGEKTWELRGSATKQRGSIALIKSRSGHVVRRCKVVGCIGPLSRAELLDNYAKHRVPSEIIDSIAYPKTFAWVLADAVPLEPPVPYRHPSGAVIWVQLREDNCPRYQRLVDLGSSSEGASIAATALLNSERGVILRGSGP